MCSVLITPSAKRSLKKLPRKVREDIVHKSKLLEENPIAGEKLSGALHFLYSFHFKSENREYRLAYTVNHEKHRIVVHLAGNRENFYEKLRRLFK